MYLEEIIKYEINGKDRYVIRVNVEESVVKPVILKYKNVPSIFMRRDGFTNKALSGYESMLIHIRKEPCLKV